MMATATATTKARSCRLAAVVCRAEGGRPRCRVLSYPSARRAYREWVRRAGLEPAWQCSIEHVVPQRVLRLLPAPPPLGDMHNFLLYPVRLNSVRGHLRMGGEAEALALLAALDAAPSALRRVDDLGNAWAGAAGGIEAAAAGGWTAWPGEAGKTTTAANGAWACGGRLFVPPGRHRGRIARAVAYMGLQYPRLGALLQDAVLDGETMVEWHRDFPVTAEEGAAEEFAGALQGVRNPFVTGRARVDLHGRPRTHVRRG